MEIVSTIVLTMAWAIPLVVLLFVAWVAMQNIRSARQDKKTKMNGVNPADQIRSRPANS